MKIVRIYFEDILERIDMIDRFTAGGKESFLNSQLEQEATIRCLEIIGEILKRIDPSLLDQQPSIPWKKIMRFRDFVIHQYSRIEPEIVWNIVEDDLNPLRKAIQALIASLPKE